MEQMKQTINANEIVVERNVINSEKPQQRTKGQKILREDTYNNPDETGSGVEGVGADDM